MLYSIAALAPTALTMGAPMRSNGVVARAGAPQMGVGLLYSTTTGASNARTERAA